MNKAGLYFHIPFCLRKCAYCDFCSFTGQNEEVMRAYTDALICEMTAYRDAARDTVFDTLFFGGGTPSLLPITCVFRVLDAAVRLFRVERDAEITLEANPATADAEKLSALRALGINRLSVGVQSLSDGELAYLGRLHTSKEALAFLSDTRKAGFDNVNVDLMYGIPAQTLSSAQKTLRGILSFAPEHISAYSLMLEEGTPLFRQKDTLPLPTEEEEEKIDETVFSMLADCGYRRYEISNYAKAGKECRHNLHYWHSDEYLGFGVAAYSYFGGARYGNVPSLPTYLASPAEAITERETVDEAALAYEWIMLRLRLSEGLSLSEYNARFGINLKERHKESLARFLSHGLMQEENGRIFLTGKGRRVSNQILVALMPDE